MLGIDLQGESLALGALTGLGYGLLAAGLILTFRTSRVINLAHGQTGAFGAVFFAVMVLKWRVPYWLAFLPALAAAGLVSAAIEVVAVRRLRRAPAVMTLIATLGISVLLLQAGAAIALTLPPGELFPQPPGLPSEQLGALLVTQSSFGLLIFGPLCVLGIAALVTRSRFGLRLQASSANPDGARALGISTATTTTLAWAIAGALAALTSIFVLPAGDLAAAPVLGPTLLLRALAAALIARMTSLPGAVLAGVGIGVVEGVVQWNLPRGDLTDGLLFAVIFALLGLRALRRPAAWRREDWTAVSRWPRLPAEALAVPVVRLAGPVLAAALLAAAAALPVLAGPADELRLFSVALFALAALSVWVATGVGGQLSLGQFAIAGLGAVVAVRLSSLSPLLGFLAAPVAGAAAGLLLGAPALRGDAVALAVVTLAFSITAEFWLLGRSWALGDGAHADTLQVGPLDLGSTASRYWLALGLLAICMVGGRALVRGRQGRRMVALRDNEAAARLLGVPALRTRVLTLALSGALAGLVGGLAAQGYYLVSPQGFSTLDSIDAVAAAAVGGLGVVGGSLAGALYIVALPEFVDLSSAAVAATAAGWVFLIVQFPSGLAGALGPLRLRAVELLLRAAGRDPSLAHRARPPDSMPAARLAAGRSGRARCPPPLRLDRVTKRYGGVVALDGVELEVSPGEAVAVIGPNGAGKTTMLDVASGLTVADAGRVLLDGIDLAGMVPEARAARGLGRSLQEAVLFPTLTVLEVLQLALEAGGRRRDCERHARDLAARLGLVLSAGSEVRALSTGMRRVLELGAVLAREPRVLLLDEPSAGIAQRERAALIDLLCDVRERLDVSLLLVEHDMSVVAGLAERVVVLEEGRIAREGEPAAILAGAAR